MAGPNNSGLDVMRQLADNLGTDAADLSPQSASRPKAANKRNVDQMEGTNRGEGCKSDKGDSSWEDQDTSDESRLEIHEPKKKKVRKKKSQRRQIVVPEEIVKECSAMLSLDTSLDATAVTHNLTTAQVKMVLKGIVQSPELLTMLRNFGAATDDGEETPAAEPKMTRAMTKTLTEAGDVVPWIVAPATPVKDPPPEIVSLVTEDFPDEEEGDPEYMPDGHSDDDDDSSFLVSELSEFGTPRTNVSSCYTPQVQTPNSQSMDSVSTPDGFRRPLEGRSTPRSHASSATRLLNFEPQESEGYATRSRRPLVDQAIEDIEQQFVPFDITPDMYEVTCDNEDYAEFLRTLHAGGSAADRVRPEEEAPPAVAGGGGNCADDDPTDPEFVYCADEADSQLADPEELRNDKATKITKKEVADLMAELLECTGHDGQQDSDNEAVGGPARQNKKKNKLAGIKKRKLGANLGGCDLDKDADVEAAEEEPVGFTQHQYEQLQVQVQQHVQLLTQMCLLTSHNPHWRNQHSISFNLLTELDSAGPVSVLRPSTLRPSVTCVQQWDAVGSDPTVVKLNRNAKKKKREIFNLSTELMDFVCHQNVFVFPRMLPRSGLDVNSSRMVWLDEEDHLLTMAIDKLQRNMKRFGKNNVADMTSDISSGYLPPKSPLQIATRIKNLRREKEKRNPVKTLYNEGIVTIDREVEFVQQIDKSLLGMVASGRRDLPPLWMSHIVGIQTKNRPMKLLPAPTGLEPMNEAAEVLITFRLDAGGGGEDDMAASDDALMQDNSRTLMCVDGNNKTPSTTSDSDTPGPSLDDGTAQNKSPLKKISVGRYVKSPLKAASDRILKKYKHTSPHKQRRRPVLPRLQLSPVKVGQPITPRRLVPKPPPLPEPAPLATTPPPPVRQEEEEDAADTPTGPPGKRKSRIQKEAELTLSLLSDLETEEDREAREAKESTEMFQQIRDAIGDDGPAFEQFEATMASAEEIGVVETYKSLHKLLDGHPEVQELLLDLLSPEEASAVDSQTYYAYYQRSKMKKFVLKLGAAYRHQPAYHTRVVKEFETLCTSSHLTPHDLKAAATRLFRHNQHLLDEFMSLIPGLSPPDTALPLPETLSYPSDSDQSWASDDLAQETLSVSRSPQPDTCKCGGACQSCTVRFVEGEVFTMDGKVMKPARVDYMANSTQDKG